MPVFDEKTGELIGPGGEDYVIISAEALRRINRQEELMFGSGSFVIWYNSGKAVGRTDGHRFAPLAQEMEIPEIAVYLRDFYSKYGWGYIEFQNVDADKGEVVFTVKNSPLVKGIESAEPRCWFVRGFVEGLVSELLGTEAVATEVRCQAMFNSDHCEFRIRWHNGILP
jgi:predicted hydrocarbon binding protein